MLGASPGPVVTVRMPVIERARAVLLTHFFVLLRRKRASAFRGRRWRLAARGFARTRRLWHARRQRRRCIRCRCSEQDRQDRRHRAPVRRPRRARSRHQELGRPGHQAGQRQQDHPRLDPRDRGRGRRGEARRRQERRDQARVRQGRRRCRRHAELQRRAERAAGAVVRQDHDGLAGQHQPVAHPGRRLRDRPGAHLPELLPHLPRPTRSRARSRRATCSRRPASRRSRRSTTRRPTARAWSTPSPTSTRSSAARSSAAETINPDDDKYDAVISKIKPSNPKAVYYGGEFPQAGPFSQQMKAAGLNVPLMGGDGIFSGEYIKLAGATADGDLATSVGAPTDTLPSATAFVEAYKAAGYQEPYEAYGAYAFDAANAIINALKTSLASADSRRGGPSGHHRRDGQGRLRRRDRQGRVRRVRRHHDQGPHRVQGRRTASGRRSTPRPSRPSDLGQVAPARRRRGWSSRTTPAVSRPRRRVAQGAAATLAADAVWCATPHDAAATLPQPFTSTRRSWWTPSPSSSSTG